MLAVTVLIICAVGILGGFCLVTLTQISWYYGIAIVAASGIMALGNPLSVIPEAVYKTKHLLLRLRLGHILWFAVFFISTCIFRARDSVQLAQNPFDLAASVRILSVTAAGIVVFGTGMMKQRDFIAKLVRGLPGLMFVYGVFGVVSVFWSPFRSLTMYKACEIIVDVGMIAFFLSYYSSPLQMKKWIDFTWFMVALLVGSVWLGAIIFPSKAFYFSNRMGMLGWQIRGLMPNMSRNTVGVQGAILMIPGLSRVLCAHSQKERLMYVGVFLVGAITLVLAQFRTGMFGITFAILVMLLFDKRIKLLSFAVISIVLGMILTDLPSSLLRFVMRGQSSSMFLSFTGRLNWWSAGWEVFQRSPIIGHGFGAGVRYVVFNSIGNYKTSTLHNGWLEILVNVGILGLIPVAVVFIRVWWRLLRMNFRPPLWFDRTMHMLSIEMIGLFTLLSVLSVTSGDSSFLHSRDTLLFLLVVAFTQQIWNLERQRQ